MKPIFKTIIISAILILSCTEIFAQGNTANYYIPQIDSIALSLGSTVRMLFINSDTISTDGTSYSWRYEAIDWTPERWINYFFHTKGNSVVYDSLNTLRVAGLFVIYIPWVDSDSAMAMADRQGGKSFRNNNPNYKIKASLYMLSFPPFIPIWTFSYFSFDNAANNITLNIDATDYSKFVPGKVQLSLPVDNSTGITYPVGLIWNSVPGTISYRVQLSTDSSFTSVIVDTTGLTSLSFPLFTLNNLTEYYWRVNATNAVGTGPWSQVWNFWTIGMPYRTELLYPPANSQNIPVNVNFKWNRPQEKLLKLLIDNYPFKINNVNIKNFYSGKKKTANVTRYCFELTDDSTKMNYLVYDTTFTDTTKQVSGLHYMTNYWWRVKAANEAGWGDSAGWSSFTTIVNPPEIVELISPNNTSKITDTVSSILFVWKNASFTNSYNLQIATDNKFNTIIIDTTGITDTVFTYHPKNLTRTFYWRVCGYNIGGFGPWSSIINFSLITGIINQNNNVPVDYALYQNYPNPFNPITIISYALPKASHVTIKVYDILGREVATLVNDEKNVGIYSVEFNASKLASGIYLYKIQAGNFTETKKLILMK
jgi:hypothetical protein